MTQDEETAETTEPEEDTEPEEEKKPGYERLEEFSANPRRALWTLSVPIIVGMSIQTLYMVVDMVFVGRVGPDALTALAFNVPLLFIAMGIVFGLGSAITALIAQAIGARDKKQADGVAEHAVVLSIVLTVLFTVVGLLYGQRVLVILGVPPELEVLSWSYLQVIVMGYVFMVTAVFLRSIMSGEGDVKLPVIIQVIGTVVNIVLDPIFIFTLELGVKGAALATIVSQALVALALMGLFFGLKRSHVDVHLSRFRWNRTIVADIFRIGTPASLSFLVMGIGGGAFNRILVEFSSDAVAAQQIGMRLDHVVVLPIVAISYSMVTLVGMFYGARRHDLLTEIVRYALVRTVLIGIAVAAIFFVSAPYLVAIFTDSESIRELAVLYVRTVSFAYPFFPISMITGRCLQGLGRGAPELVLSLLRVLLIGVPLAFIFTMWLDLGVRYVWIAMIIGSVTSAAIAGFWLWRALRNLTGPLEGSET